ncbi:mannosyltransferase [Microdochium trichocladiopsis]|uniref:GPI mannosyltransferase 2 n=1 Tax=Microdochium trichocladiopsis TaxID=1682393 RepID=A0A9P8Y2W9_9PEZI|nr:mannosyltransferase [Microdochium trichocladiopsis]KAH7028111.1 mannosyltransferase [Microdochium trichocladiopsis]
MASMLVDPAQPQASLVRVFTAWKSVLLAITIGSGIAQPYDTSTTLVTIDRPAPSNEAAWDIASKLTRWDAIYFVQTARRGYVYEQERAFAAGPSWLMARIVQGLSLIGLDTSTGTFESLAGIAVSHLSHLLSVLVLYQLCLAISNQKKPSFTAAILHIISPAGLFLSAPYAESVFSLLSFLGYLFLAKGLLGNQKRRLAHDASLVSSGLWFGFSCTFRSNGLFSGIPFAVALLVELTCSPPTLPNIRRRFALVLGGLAIAVGFIAPQFSAYLSFCVRPSGEALRPWCDKALPSIYTFVQEHYWNVGFLRYWVPGNMPLFLLAGPVLYLMIRSGIDTLQAPSGLASAASSDPGNIQAVWLGRSMAITQLLIAGLAITNFHIQIITRIASAYPLWYLWLANKLCNGKTSRFGGHVVIFMILYATIQGALFASFMPPA